MKRRFLISALAFAVILVALGGWTVDGARWAVGAARA
jgi:hypothetical protein